jgi:quinol monooxygenase YgiN
MSESVTILAIQYPKPDRRDALLERIRSLALEARHEAGCLEYRVVIAPDRPDAIHFIEQWASQEALDAHFRSDTFQAFWSVRTEYLERDVDIVVGTDFV